MPRLSLPVLRSSALLLASLTLAACAFGTQTQLPGGLRSFGVQRNLAKPDVITTTSPNQNDRPDGARISAIVLHHTATTDSARQVAAFFANPKAQVSSHYIVDRTGYIVQPVPDNLRSWHAGRSEFLGKSNVNDFSIGIEICNVGDSLEPYSDVQYDAVIRLVAWLVEEYHIPLTSITRHRDVAIPAGRKIDTSNNFSVARVVDGVKAMMAGTYAPPVQNAPQTPVQVPAFKEVTVSANEKTMADLADIYLDAPSRAAEIQQLNPQIQPNALKPGQKVKLPTNLNLAFK